MPDGAFLHALGWPLVMDERTAARFLSLTLRDFRLAVEAGLAPAGRTPQDLAAAGLLTAEGATKLACLGPLWHRAEVEARFATLWGLEGQARVGQADQARAARDALDAFQPPAPRPRLRQAHPPRR